MKLRKKHFSQDICQLGENNINNDIDNKDR